MKKILSKITLILVLTVLFISCNAVKRLQEDQLLLTENTVIVDTVKSKSEDVYSLLNQKPNPKIPLLGIPLGLHIYNLAEPNPDSTYINWLEKKPNRRKKLEKLLSKKQVEGIKSSKTNFNNWLKRTGTPPVVIDEKKAEKSLKQLKRYYYTQGWFNVEGNYKVVKDSSNNKRASIVYNIQRKKPYFIDSVSKIIASPIIDSLFNQTIDKSFIESGKQYDINDLLNERARITLQLRNSGLFYFDEDYVRFDADTNNLNQKVHLEYIIPNRRIYTSDSTQTVPFKIHTINKVNVVTDYDYKKRELPLKDSVVYKGVNLYSYETLKYKPKTIVNSIAIKPNEIFKDIDRTLTYNQINQLRNFKYPSITYAEDPEDTTGTGLITTILLSPRKKYTTDFNFDSYTSPIQIFGIGFSGSLLTRNVFGGAENLEIGFNGSVGSSLDVAKTDNRFFNTSDVGGNIKLTFPSILFPVKTEKIIPYFMAPTTSISTGINTQNNIGLDRQSINGMFTYQWKPSPAITNKLDIANLRYIRNLNPDNYFNVYRSSYNRINEIAQEIGYSFLNENEELEIPNEINGFLDLFFSNDNGFTTTVDQLEVMNSEVQRKNRLSENNLIFATTYTWTRDTRENIADDSFSILQLKGEVAGNTLSTLASALNLEENENGNRKLFGVVFSQYTKLEANYIKHWKLSSTNIFAIRAFGGIAIPYGNSTNIPFIQSYFAGGTNDNRGWRAYDLGPGSSGGLLDFNEANFKLAFNAEYRFPFFGSFKGAFFADAGNIWNVFDDVTQEEFQFNGLQDLSELALATGIGFRYDAGFFVFRLDLGFKTYDPGRPLGERWFKDYNLANTVFNIGINYPF